MHIMTYIFVRIHYLIIYLILYRLSPGPASPCTQRHNLITSQIFHNILRSGLQFPEVPGIFILICKEKVVIKLLQLFCRLPLPLQ